MNDFQMTQISQDRTTNCGPRPTAAAWPLTAVIGRHVRLAGCWHCPGSAVASALPPILRRTPV